MPGHYRPGHLLYGPTVEAGDINELYVMKVPDRFALAQDPWFTWSAGYATLASGMRDVSVMFHRHLAFYVYTDELPVQNEPATVGVFMCHEQFPADAGPPYVCTRRGGHRWSHQTIRKIGTGPVTHGRVVAEWRQR